MTLSNMASTAVENSQEPADNECDVKIESTHQSSWYKYFNDVQANLSSYNLQKDLHQYNITDMKKRISEGAAVLKHDDPPSTEQLEDAYHFIDLIMKTPVQSYSTSNELVIKGYNIKLSDFIKEETIFRNSSVDAITFFALNKIFIDRNIKLVGFNAISIISPKWEIIGSRKIELRGIHGEVYESDGKDGKPGGPGGPGASFFGIGEKFINGEGLIIKSIGGKGGRGGNGQRGSDGKDGSSPSRISDFMDKPGGKRCTDGQIQNSKGEFFGCVDDVYTPVNSYNFWPMVITAKYNISGTAGKDGEDGGNGGKGGKGGKSGNIVLFELNDDANILTKTRDGPAGIDGKGGLGGIGGRHGYNLHAIYEEIPAQKWTESKVHDDYPIRNGHNGTDGANYSGIQEPAVAASIDKLKVINDYKNYLFENLNDRLKKCSFMETLDNLENNDKINSVYNTLGLFNELQALETNFYKLKKYQLSHLYRSLLKRISDYAKYPKDNENSHEYKVVLSYLYTATLGRIYNLEDRPESHLILDVIVHLNMVKDSVVDLTKLQETDNKARIIQDYTEKYKRGLDEKMNEAKKIVKEYVIPEIKENNRMIDVQVNSLIDKALELQKKLGMENQKLEAAMGELETALKLSALFGVFETIGLLLTFLGPEGAVLSVLVGSVINVAQELLINDVTIPNENNRFELDLLDKSDIGKGTSAEKSNDILSKMSNINKKLSSLSGKNLRIKKDVDDYRYVGDKGNNLFSKYKTNRAKIDIINEAIKRNKDLSKKLDKYEEIVRIKISPMLKNLEDNVEAVANNLGGKSRVTLDVVKWRVQDTLRDLKLQMKQMTEGFKDMPDNMSRCIEKLEDTMTTLINIYDRIQNYREQQELAIYIANISHPNVSKINDPELEKAARELEITIRRNVILKQYNAGIEALKISVFPFAHDFFKETTLPAHLQTETNINNVASEVVRRITEITSKVATYRNGASYNANVKTGTFNRNSKTKAPFFVWKNEEHNQLIKRLLSGEKVVVEADVRRSPKYADAIKINVATFHFHAKNNSMRKEVYKAFSYFDMQATHLGNSYFRCKDKIYSLTGNDITLTYSIRKNLLMPDRPDHISLTYENLEKSDYILSPYAGWEIQLEKTSEKSDFDNLKKYENEVDIDLVGRGRYIKTNNTNWSELMIDDYYTPIDTLKSPVPSSHSDGRHGRSADRIDSAGIDDTMNATYMGSFINYIGNLFEKNSSKLTFLSPVEENKSWFEYNENRMDQGNNEDFIDNGNDSLNQNFTGIKLHETENNADQISNDFIDKGSNLSNPVNYNLLNGTNLLLLDVLIRKKNGRKYKNDDIAMKNNTDTKYAQKLAYSAYGAKDD